MTFKWHYGLIVVLAVNLSACGLDGLTSPFSSDDASTSSTEAKKTSSDSTYTPNVNGRRYNAGSQPVRRAVKTEEAADAGPTDGPTGPKGITPSKIPVVE